MNTEALQAKHKELQQRLLSIREQTRQVEAQLQDLANAEQQLIGAVSIVRELMAVQPEAAQPAPSATAALPTPPVDNVSDH